MKGQILRRIAIYLATVFIVSILSFLAMEGGGAYVLGDDAAEGNIERYREEKGLDRPFPVRYLEYMKGYFSGDWGKTEGGKDARTEVLSRLPLTLSISVFSLLLSLLISIPLTLWCWEKDGGKRKAVHTALSVIFLVFPSFITCLILVLIFSIGLKLFPVSGYISPINGIIPFLRSLFLPSLSLALLHSSVMLRMLGKEMESTLGENFSTFEMAKGMKRRELPRKSSLRLLLPLILSLSSEAFALSLSGAAVVESVFALPGLGSLLLRAALERDAPLASASLITVSLMVATVYLAGDVAIYLSDPRQRRGYE